MSRPVDSTGQEDDSDEDEPKCSLLQRSRPLDQPTSTATSKAVSKSEPAAGWPLRVATRSRTFCTPCKVSIWTWCGVNFAIRAERRENLGYSNRPILPGWRSGRRKTIFGQAAFSGASACVPSSAVLLDCQTMMQHCPDTPSSVRYPPSSSARLY